MSAADFAYVLWVADAERTADQDEADYQIAGVFSTELAAQYAQGSLQTSSNGANKALFFVEACQVGEINWAEGFVTLVTDEPSRATGGDNE